MEGQSTILSQDHFTDPTSVLELALDTTFNLLRPDISLLYLHNQISGNYEIKSFRKENGTDLELIHQTLDLKKIIDHHRSHARELAPLESTKEFLKPASWHDSIQPFLLSIPFLEGDHLLGFLTTVSFSRLKKLTSFQQKTLMILASRVARSECGGAVDAPPPNPDLFKEAILAFAQSMEGRDTYTASHSDRVRVFTQFILAKFDLPEPKRDIILEGAHLHDIGKLGVDLSALNNSGKLSQEEVLAFRAHPLMGKEILQPIALFKGVVPLVFHHHENFDGSGYPNKLSGLEIPLGSRIIAVADTYDAMTSHRPYRRAMGIEKAIAELKRCAGRQFDPEIVDIFVEEVEKHRNDRRFSHHFAPQEKPPK